MLRQSLPPAMPSLPPSCCVSLLIKTLGRVLRPQQSDPKSWREGATFPCQSLGPTPEGPGSHLLSQPTAPVSVAHPGTPEAQVEPLLRIGGRMVVRMVSQALPEAQSHPLLSSRAEWEAMAPRGPGVRSRHGSSGNLGSSPAPVAVGSRDTFSSGFY